MSRLYRYLFSITGVIYSDLVSLRLMHLDISTEGISRKEFTNYRGGMAALERSVMHRSRGFLFLEISLDTDTVFERNPIILFVARSPQI